jgi:uncharacterized repeat protein (TIGR03803 family)
MQMPSVFNSLGLSFLGAIRLNRSLLIFLLGCFVAMTLSDTIPRATAQTFKVLYKFAGGTSDGENPAGGLITDDAGNLYGTTEGGGTHSAGTIFLATTTGKEHLLYSLTLTEGIGPVSALARDKSGNLYGTAPFGGSLKCDGGVGCGTVFKLNPAGTLKVIHSFQDKADGAAPLARVVLDTPGNIYGTTPAGGIVTCQLGGSYSGCGVVFKFTPGGTESELYKFNRSNNGLSPWGGLTMDSEGTLYGTTQGGPGNSGCGTVFKINKNVETILHVFDCSGSEGYLPTAGVVLDSAGNIYGTTPVGGTRCGTQCGTVFKIDMSGLYTVLHNFTGKSDGGSPGGELLIDSGGNLYGTTAAGGNLKCSGGMGCGTVFRINANGVFKVLHAFSGGGSGSGPIGPIALDLKGNLYGITTLGGNLNCNKPDGCGTIFSITP